MHPNGQFLEAVERGGLPPAKFVGAVVAEIMVADQRRGSACGSQVGASVRAVGTVGERAEELPKLTYMRAWRSARKIAFAPEVAMSARREA